MPLGVGFEFLLNTYKHKKSAKVLVEIDLRSDVCLNY